MEDETALPADPLLSRAETLSGLGSGTVFQMAAARITQAPEFPVQDWDRYEFLGFLGQGGMGMVFRCRDRRLDREVAIKFVRIEDERHLQRFMVEARAQARVDHEHVCKVFEVGEVEGRVFIAMQHIAGTSLDVASRALSLEQKAIVLRDAARGVQEAHRVGIIHRDIKPSNIMVERTEEGALRTFVMDFGLAREWNRDVTETGSVLGTPAYMSPEQARGEVSRLDRRTDVYSLGAALYHVITGRLPVSGSNPLEILSAVGSADVEPMRTPRMDIPRDLEAITLKCLEKDRAKRYDSAKLLADDLDRFLSGEPVQARSTGLWYRIQRKLLKHRQLAAVGAVAVLLVLLALGAAVKARRDAGRRERLAQRFTDAMARIESVARYSALSPLHDIHPDLEAVQAHMAALRREMDQAGSIARGPGHYALGCGFRTLDDGEKAREHLQMAWDAGFREPRVAYALAVELGRQYQQELLEAERIPAEDQRRAREQEIESTLRAPALAFLRQARGSDAPSPIYLAALMAFYEGRTDAALGHLQALGNDLPWFYEAPLLRGSLLQTRAWRRWNQGDRDGAHADFEAGRSALAAAAASGRSAPAVHAALADLELNALLMEKYGEGKVEPAFNRGIAAVDTALAARSDHPPSLITLSSLLCHFADFRAQRGEKVDDLLQRAVAAAGKAVAAGPDRAHARIALGRSYYQLGDARADQNLDPSDPLGRGLQMLESVSPGKRDYTAENHIGLIHQTWSDYEGRNGRDPAVHLGGAIVSFRRATEMEPRLLPAWINLGTCLLQRAGLPGAADPEGDLAAALEVVGRAHGLNPKHFVPCFVEGKVLMAMALRKRDRGEDPEPDLQRSVQAQRRGIAINPAIPHLHNAMGSAQLELARSAWETGRDPLPLLLQAQASYLRAAAAAPGQAYSYCNLGELMTCKARWRGERGAGPSLREAEAHLRKALQHSPTEILAWANLGHVFAERAEGAVREGIDPAASLASGEAALAKALAQDPRHRDSLQYLGELRSAAVAWKARNRRASRADFEWAEQPLKKILEGRPGDAETLLSLGRLAHLQAGWERRLGQDPATTLAAARRFAEQARKARPNWAEALALLAGLSLEEAEALPEADPSRKAADARQLIGEALALNRNRKDEWQALADRAQGLESGRLSR